MKICKTCKNFDEGYCERLAVRPHLVYGHEPIDRDAGLERSWFYSLVNKNACGPKAKHWKAKN